MQAAQTEFMNAALHVNNANNVVGQIREGIAKPRPNFNELKSKFEEAQRELNDAQESLDNCKIDLETIEKEE